jgi:hypothetical protein
MQALGREGGAGDFLRFSQHGDYGKAEALFVIDKIKQIIRR